jgi:LuxR family maltose regulon positive regulatory protein
MTRALALVDSSNDSWNQETTDLTNVANQLLATKLYVPRSRSDLVVRPRLSALLRDGDTRKLTLITAPAGFGKTTLVAAWLAELGLAENAAWVSLDASENEPRLFWAYVITALQTSDPSVGRQALALLQSVQPPAIERVLTTLINDIAVADADFMLALDDYHVIGDERIHAALTFLLDRLPPRMSVVIASRSEPPLALPRLRARGELSEVRAADLRFTREETATFLNQVMALDLSPNDLGTLEQRTEGWIAGLKLAAISMKGRGDKRRFVEESSGENRYVADYLVEEVLQSEPEHMRQLLLATAILDRLSGPLCDAITGQTGSQGLLEELERRNLFVVALDDRREWYRYHHLFADVLQKQSLARDPDAARSHHGRASAWYEAHGSPGDAVRHALAAGDTERAANLLERTWPEKNRSYESANWLARVKTLPDAVIRARPVLGMAYTWGLLNGGELEAAEPRLRDVELALEGDRSRLVIGDEQRFQSLATELDSARIYLTQSLGDTPGTLEHAARALESIPENDLAARATGTALVALALWGRGELDRAHRTFSEALAAMRAAGHELDAIRGMFVLGDIRVAQGRLREAARVYERGLEVAGESSQFADAETDELHLGLSELHREWNDPASATTHLETIARRADRSAHKGNRLRWCTAMAKIHEARGDRDGALELLDEAEKHERRDPIPRARPIPALKARIRIAQGKLDDAMSWARKAGVGIDDEVSYLREFEHVTLARLLVAQAKPPADDAVQLLERLRVAAQTGGRIGSVIEVLMLTSLARQSSGNMRGALDPLVEALTLAEPEGYLRVFLDEGTRMRDLLRTATARGLAGAYTRRVLAAFDAPTPSIIPSGANGHAASPGQSLTTRELEILRLIAAGLRNQEIADHLSISAATVKRHIANAYAKLGAGHRTEALARAAEMKLL